MITLSETARKELDAYFADKDKAGVRVFLATGGCSGARLALALDEPTADDAVFENSGYTLCIGKDLYEQSGDISIDMSYMGFVVESALDIPGIGAGGCASCGGGCGAY
jgi:Fe-S cluster assembly iron-binding protein IscA